MVHPRQRLTTDGPRRREAHGWGWDLGTPTAIDSLTVRVDARRGRRRSFVSISVSRANPFLAGARLTGDDAIPPSRSVLLASFFFSIKGVFIT